MDPKLRRFRLTEVPINNANGTKFLFQVDETLQDAKQIVAVQAYTAEDVPVSPYSQLTLVPDAVFNNAFLTLITVDGNDEVVSKIPLNDLNKKEQDGRLQYFDIPKINVTKCYIEVSSNAGISVNNVFLLAFHFMTEDDYTRKKGEEPAYMAP